MDEITVYTDGACRGNPGPGGWGAVLTFGEHQRELFGFEPESTNNRMELTAAIKALEALKRPCRVRVYTDSTYVKKGITEWLDDWKRRGWKTAGKQAVKNVDLWTRLDELCGEHKVSWHWVKGHAGNPGNERADALANQAIDMATPARASGAK